MAGVRLMILAIIGITVLYAVPAGACGCSKQQGLSANLQGLGNPVTYVSDNEDMIAREFPWHVGIFKKERGFIFKKDEFRFRCAGSIIKKKLILTAAHCFDMSEDPADYKVVAAKYHKSWAVTDYMEQRIDVESVEIKPTYQGESSDDADDIAVLILKDEVILTGFVQPIGVDLDSQYVNLQLSVGVDGYLATWGYFQNWTDNNLLGKRVLRLQEYERCYEDSSMRSRKYFTSDKFCAKFVSEKRVCFRDSGGALAFEQKVSPTKRQWFVQGISILGTKSSEESPCNDEPILFTKVSNHIEWLREYYNKY